VPVARARLTSARDRDVVRKCRSKKSQRGCDGGRWHSASRARRVVPRSLHDVKQMPPVLISARRGTW